MTRRLSDNDVIARRRRADQWFKDHPWLDRAGYALFRALPKPVVLWIAWRVTLYKMRRNGWSEDDFKAILDDIERSRP